MNDDSWQEPTRDFLNGLKGSKAPNTVIYYRKQVFALEKWAHTNGVTLKAFTAKDMRSYMADRQDNVSENTLRHSAIAARVFMRFCCRAKHIKRDPLKDYKVPAGDIPPINCPSVDELIRILQAVHTSHDPETDKAARFFSEKQRAYLRIRDHALICMLIDTGMRIGECIDLDLEDFRPAELIIAIKKTKTNRGRNIPITEGLREALNAYLKLRPVCDTAAFFVTRYGGRLTYRPFARSFALYCAHAGTPIYTPHKIRHRAVTEFARIDLESARLLAGHAKLTTTQRYLHTDADLIRKDHAEGSPLARVLQSKRTYNRRKSLI